MVGPSTGPVDWGRLKAPKNADVFTHDATRGRYVAMVIHACCGWVTSWLQDLGTGFHGRVVGWLQDLGIGLPWLYWACTPWPIMLLHAFLVQHVAMTIYGLGGLVRRVAMAIYSCRVAQRWGGIVHDVAMGLFVAVLVYKVFFSVAIVFLVITLSVITVSVVKIFTTILKCAYWILCIPWQLHWLSWCCYWVTELPTWYKIAFSCMWPLFPLPPATTPQQGGVQSAAGVGCVQGGQCAHYFMRPLTPLHAHVPPAGRASPISITKQCRGWCPPLLPLLHPVLWLVLPPLPPIPPP